MAEVLIKRIQFTSANPFGEYIAGDVVEVYYDASADPTPIVGGTVGYKVKYNGGYISSGADVAYQDKPYKNTTISNPIICNGTTRIGPGIDRNAFPYAYNVLYPNSPSCTVDPEPVVCNLNVIGVPQVTPASSEIVNDGQIIIAASSTNLIQYKLNSDFVYGDGTGQTTGIFTGLAPGTYRIYLRDSKNCPANTLVTVGIDTSYGDWKIVTYKNERISKRTWIRVQKKLFTDPATYSIAGDEPFTVSSRGEFNNDKFTPVFQTTAQLKLGSQTNFEYQGIFTNNPKGFRVKYYKDLPDDYNEGTDPYQTGDRVFLLETPAGDILGKVYESLADDNIDNNPFDSLSWTEIPIDEYLKWIGYVLPQQYMEDYKAPPYYTSISCKDGISDLANLLFVQDDGQDFYGRTRTIELIAFCLRKTGLNLNIRSAVNMYATDMDQGDADDPLDQAYVDPEAFYLNGTPTIDYVLNELIRPYRARLLQWDGCWNIVRIEEMVDAYDYREFNPYGTYQSNSSFDPLVEVRTKTQDGLAWAGENQNLELRPGYGKSRVVYHLGPKPNILRNGDFRAKSFFSPLLNSYISEVDRNGFQLVAPYAIAEGMEFLDSGNVAYTMTSDAPVTSGEAYLQSDTYQMSMGLSNTIKISVTFKLPVPLARGLAVDDEGNLQFYWRPFTCRYQKVRLLVQLGNRYLQSDGTWTITRSEVVCYCDTFGEYASFELTASSPGEDFASDHDFKVRIYHSWQGHAEFQTLADLKARVTDAGNYRGTYDASSDLFPSTGGSGGGGAIQQGDYWAINVDGVLGGVIVTGTGNYKVVAAVNAPGQDPTKWAIIVGEVNNLPIGTKTELRTGPDSLSYYELQESTDPADDIHIIRPNDYDGTGGTNPVQWILQGGSGFTQAPTIPFYIDQISVQFLDQGKSIIDTVIRELPGEDDNNLILSEEIFFGSLLNSISTNVITAVQPVQKFNPFTPGGSTFPVNIALPRISNFLVTQSVLSGKLVFTGYISDADGNGYVNWARDGAAEMATLHELFMRSAIGQYPHSWRKITGSLVANNQQLGLLNVIKEMNQGEIIYMPQALTIRDRSAGYDGEFLELIDIRDEVVSPYSSGFTSGFGGGFD